MKNESLKSRQKNICSKKEKETVKMSCRKKNEERIREKLKEKYLLNERKESKNIFPTGI